MSESRRSSWKKRWVWSVVAVAAATALDAHSSMGRYEANPLLRNSRGQFSSSRGFAIKAASSGGMIALEAFLARKNPEVYRSSAYVNFVSAGAFSAVAIRNRLTK